jgi:outer membrane protein insertion porin family/translocation and assembly module TamA
VRQLILRALLPAFLVCCVACQEDGVVKVHSLKFNGVEHVDESALKSVLATHVSSRIPWGAKAYFDRARFDDDVKRIHTFYVDRGYDEARVTGYDAHLNTKGDAVDITVTVSEGVPVRVAALNFIGFDVLPPANLTALRTRSPLHPGQARDRQLVLAVHERASNELRDHGYPYSVVNVTEDDGQDGKSATLTFEAVPGQLAHFGPVEVRGNTRVSETVIRRGLPYTEGQLYRRSVLQETQRRLYATQLFQFVTVAPTAPGTTDAGVSVESTGGTGDQTSVIVNAPSPADESPDVPTRITVAESKPQRTTLSVGYGTEEKARADAQYRRLNFLGGGRTAEAHLRWSSLDRGALLTFNQPYFLAPGLSFGLIGQQWYTTTPAYHSTVSGGKATLTHRTSRRTYWAVSITSERDASSVDSAVLNNAALRNYLIALGLNPVTGQQSGILNAVGFDIQWSTVDNVLNATRGYQATFHTEQAGRILPGSFSYTSFSVEGRHFLPMGKSLVWANRAQVANLSPGGNSDTDVPFGKRYFLGGSTSLRGWGIYEVGPLAGGLPVGGDSMVSFTSEMRAQLHGKLGGVLFLDGGNVWADSFGMKLGDLRYAVGPGLRYQTPIGPLRLDVGYQVNPEPGLLVNGLPQGRRWRLHFSVGQAF